MAQSIVNDFRPSWIKEKIEESCIKFMDNFGLFLCDKKDKNDRFPGFNAVTTSQIRNIFAEVKRIEAQLVDDESWQREEASILLLRPKIAYNTARVTGSKRESRMIQLREVLEKGLQAIAGPDDFKRFCRFFEGILAYHKVYGGKD